jgi:uncharacterized membrane protein (DUF2068 family)
MNPSSADRGHSVLGFRIIGAMKLASGVLLAAAGVGIFRLVHQDLGKTLERFILRLHLDPENQVVQTLLSRAGGIDPKELKILGTGTFFYALLHLIEGTGLLLNRLWAGYLTVIITGSLLPLEVYEITRKVSAVRIGVFAANLAIVIYLIIQLRREPRKTS